MSAFGDHQRLERRIQDAEVALEQAQGLVSEATWLLDTLSAVNGAAAEPGPRGHGSDEESRAQRAERGWADTDVWALDTYIANVLHGALRHLADNTLTSPPTLSREEWRDLLEEIAAGFGAWAACNGSTHDEYTLQLVRHSLKLLRHWWAHLWD